jgi:hypothetical protein
MQLFSWATLHYYDFWQPILERYEIDSTNPFSIFAYINCFPLYGIYFSRTIPNPKLKKPILYGSYFLMGITSIDYFFVTGYNNFSSFSQTILVFYALILPCVHLWYIYREESKVVLNRNPYFWIAFGIILPNVMSIWSNIYGSRLYEADFVLFCQVSIADILFYGIGMLLIARGFYFAYYAQYLPQQQVAD